MSIFYGLKNKLLEYKNVQTSGDVFSLNDIKKTSKRDYDFEDVDKLTLGEYRLFKENIINSNVASFVLLKLKNILNVLYEKINFNRCPFDSFIYDIVNWSDRVYIGKNKPIYNWQYQMDVINDMRHYVIKLNNRKQLIMIIEVETTLKGKFLKFNAQYHIGIPDFQIKFVCGVEKNEFGTAVVEIDFSEENTIKASQSIYNLDLLNGVEYLNVVKLDNLIESIKIPLVPVDNNALCKKRK